MPDRYYVFGTEKVAYPEQGISVAHCAACGLFYKSLLPTPAFLSQVFQRQAPVKWSDVHDFDGEASLLQRLMGRTRFDLLDVGAAGGGLLSACRKQHIAGRRSALDVMRYPGIERDLSGELIEGFLDDALPAWSGEPYDIVTLFDVIEHLYDPAAAFENLRVLLRRHGLVFVETGDAMSFWPRRLGVAHWWYARLLEHHLFWSRGALARAAEMHGFRLVYWRAVRHKSHRRVLPRGAMLDSIKSALYLMASRQYSAVARFFRRQGVQPWFPFGSDHFQACLVKV